VPVIAIPLAFWRAAAFGSRAEDARAGCRRCGFNPTYRPARSRQARRRFAWRTARKNYASSGQSREARMQAKSHLKLVTPTKNEQSSPLKSAIPAIAVS